MLDERSMAITHTHRIIFSKLFSLDNASSGVCHCRARRLSVETSRRALSKGTIIFVLFRRKSNRKSVPRGFAES